ncbi:hypothetical protein KR032_005316 [Drosophila birchii]|nr:hypothetical protein KR032_005316 [Drosophila birchii]
MNCSCCGTQKKEDNKCQSDPNQKPSLIRLAVGPYPDEVIMSLLDTIILLYGEPVTKKMSCPSVPSCPPLPSCRPVPSCPPPPSCHPLQSSCSASSLGRCSSFYTMNASSCTSKVTERKGKDSPAPSTPKSVCFKAPSSRICAASRCPRYHRTPRVDFKNPADDIRKRTSSGSFSMKQQLMTAEIICSAACQALKTRLKPKKSQRSECKGQTWLWTRLIRTKNGCQVYEVYKDSNAKSSPSKIGSTAPALVFLVLRNGNIMPFETIAPK